MYLVSLAPSKYSINVRYSNRQSFLKCICVSYKDEKKEMIFKELSYYYDGLIFLATSKI